MKTPLSLFGLWVSRSLRSLVLILLGLSVLEGIFAFRALSLQSTPMLEQGLKSAHRTRGTVPRSVNPFNPKVKEAQNI